MIPSVTDCQGISDMQNSSLPLWGEADVVVAGGGPAGVAQQLQALAQATCFATGQAARRKTALRNLNVDMIQEELRAAGMLLCQRNYAPFFRWIPFLHAPPL
jgi:hypothetical protein